jgi:hypothetical protein
MKKRSKSEDFNQSAFRALQETIRISEMPTNVVVIDGSTAHAKNPAAVALGRLGGLKGGRARAAKLSKERRSEIAKQAADKRWKPKMAY